MRTKCCLQLMLLAFSSACLFFGGVGMVNQAMAMSFNATVYDGTGDYPTFTAAGDFDTDGDIDIALAVFHDTRTYIFLNNGDGSFSDPLYVDQKDGGRSITAADFNNDGKLDLATANRDPRGYYDSSVSIMLGNGDGTFVWNATYSVAESARGITNADFDGDGNLDLVVVSNDLNNVVAVLLGNGDGTFIPQAPYYTSNLPWYLEAGDLNGDGAPDLAVPTVYGGAINILLNDGNGSFSFQPIVGVGGYGRAVTLADFDGDSILDMAFTRELSNDIGVVIGNGDGTFSTLQSYAVGTYPFYVANGDFNNDGIADIVSANLNDNTISILAGQGGASFAAQEVFVVGSLPLHILPADLNNDGSEDLVVTNYGGNSITVLINTMPTPNQPPEADAGPDLYVPSGQQAATFIEGIASDPDGDDLTYRWLQGGVEVSTWQPVVGGEANLDLSALPVLALGAYTFTLEVSDGQETSADDMVLEILEDQPATIVIFGCDTEVQDFQYNGEWVSQLIADCALGAKNHGQFVSAVAHLLNELKKEGLISGRDKGSIQSCASQAEI